MSEHNINPQKQRWLKYGLNVAVLILATLVIVVLANWLAYEHYARFDFTATRRYSLSPQTQKLLNSLEQDVTITTLYAQGSEIDNLLQQVRDLLGEYERRSGHIQVRQIDPVYEVEAYEAFTEQLRQKFQEQLHPLDEALGTVEQTFDRLQQFGLEQAQQLGALLPRIQGSHQQIQTLLMQLNQFFTRLPEAATKIQAQIDQELERPLPDYTAARTAATDQLRQIRDGVLDVAIESFQKLADMPSVPGPVKDYILGQLDTYRNVRDQISQTLTRLQELEVAGYDEVRTKIEQSNSMVLATPTDLTVLSLDQVYTAPQQAQPDEVKPELRFKGEEVVTGAILSLTLQTRPRVVFINPMPQPAIGANGMYSNVAQRLTNMNFQVEEWSPIPRPGPMGQMTPPAPRPQASPGQTMVFVVLPAPPPDPQRPSASGEQAVASALRDHLAAGQPVLLFLAPSPMAAFGQADPMAALLNQYGVHPMADRVVFATEVAQGGREVPTNQIEIKDWPNGHPIAQALRGLSGIVVQGVPLEHDEKVEGVSFWPLIRTPESTWAESDYFKPDQVRKNDTDPTGPLTVGLALTRGQQRMIVLGDPAWATDTVTEYGPRLATGQSLYSLFPANADLFVNGVYWLSGLDQLIASSPRAQDVRRIEAMTRGELVTVWWLVLAGLPLLCLAAGVTVWFVRRR